MRESFVSPLSQSEIEEQARAHFDNTARKTIDKAGEVLKAGLPLEAVLGAIPAAFYSALYPFYCEKTLPREYLKPLLARKAHQEILQGIARYIERHIPRLKQAEWRSAVEGLPLFRRSLGKHLEILKDISPWFEAFGYAGDLVRETAGGREEELTNLLWRLARRRMNMKWISRSERQALKLTVKEAERLAGVYNKISFARHDASSPYPELAIQYFKAKNLWALAEALSNSADGHKVATPALQGIIDLLIKDSGVKIDIDSLRLTYGRRLHRYLTEENRPHIVYLRRLAEFYSQSADPQRRAHAVDEAHRTFRYPMLQDIRDAYGQGLVSGELAVGVLRKIGREGGGLEIIPLLGQFIGDGIAAEEAFDFLFLLAKEYPDALVTIAAHEKELAGLPSTDWKETDLKFDFYRNVHGVGVEEAMQTLARLGNKSAQRLADHFSARRKFYDSGRSNHCFALLFFGGMHFGADRQSFELPAEAPLAAVSSMIELMIDDVPVEAGSPDETTTESKETGGVEGATEETTEDSVEEEGESSCVGGLPNSALHYVGLTPLGAGALSARATLFAKI